MAWEPPFGFTSCLQRWIHRNALASLRLEWFVSLNNLFLGSPLPPSSPPLPRGDSDSRGMNFLTTPARIAIAVQFVKNVQSFLKF
ncbi:MULTISPECIES: hypothetical protein [unclassified Nostoc]|uniref:hypothetical protein n=1 Tax=unclassified Nostoc TaxID=2593658 RepID=UPI0026279A93|nr:hypothetical protein [Nostoc sp. S13]MDF5738708.1 hypothetical protein [Nostoc sp. S13]